MNKSTTRRAWRVEHINTVAITPQQYNFAVSAVAALVKQWIHKLETMNNDNAQQECDTDQKQGGNNDPIDRQTP